MEDQNSTTAGPFPFERLEWQALSVAAQKIKAAAPRVLLQGVPGSAKAFLLAWLYRDLKEGNPWLLLTPTREEALVLQDDLITWLPDTPIHLCPAWETLPQDFETPDPELVGDRQRTFYHLLQGGPGIVISPLMGALQRTMAPEPWLDEVMILKEGADAPSDLSAKLQALGY